MSQPVLVDGWLLEAGLYLVVLEVVWATKPARGKKFKRSLSRTHCNRHNPPPERH